jgi:hypothetical protein
MSDETLVWPPEATISFVPGADGRLLWSITVAAGELDDVVIALAREAARQREAIVAALAGDPPSERQLRFLRRLCDDAGRVEADFIAARYPGVTVDALTKSQVSDLISELKGDPPPGTPAGPVPALPAPPADAAFDALAGDNRPAPQEVAEARQKIADGLAWLAKRGWTGAQQISWIRKWGGLKAEAVSNIPEENLAGAVADLRGICERTQAAQRQPVAAGNGSGARRG